LMFCVHVGTPVRVFEIDRSGISSKVGKSQGSMQGRRRGREREQDRLPPSVHRRHCPSPNASLQGALALNGATFINPVLMNMGPLLFDWLYPLGLPSRACPQNSGRLENGPPPSIPTYVDLRLLNQQLLTRTDAAPESVPEAQASAVSHVVAIYPARDGRRSKGANLTEAKEAPPSIEACDALAVATHEVDIRGVLDIVLDQAAPVAHRTAGGAVPAGRIPRVLHVRAVRMGGVSEDDSSQAQLGGATEGGCARSWRWQGVPRESAPEREQMGGAAATDTREANESTARAPAARALAPLPLETWGMSAQWKQESRTRYIKLCVPSRAYQRPKGMVSHVGRFQGLRKGHICAGRQKRMVLW